MALHVQQRPAGIAWLHLGRDLDLIAVIGDAGQTIHLATGQLGVGAEQPGEGEAIGHHPLPPAHRRAGAEGQDGAGQAGHGEHGQVERRIHPRWRRGGQPAPLRRSQNDPVAAIDHMLIGHHPVGGDDEARTGGDIAGRLVGRRLRHAAGRRRGRAWGGGSGHLDGAIGADILLRQHRFPAIAQHQPQVEAAGRGVGRHHPEAGIDRQRAAHGQQRIAPIIAGAARAAHGVQRGGLGPRAVDDAKPCRRFGRLGGGGEGEQQGKDQGAAHGGHVSPRARQDKPPAG